MKQFGIKPVSTTLETEAVTDSETETVNYSEIENRAARILRERKKREHTQIVHPVHGVNEPLHPVRIFRSTSFHYEEQGDYKRYKLFTLKNSPCITLSST